MANIAKLIEKLKISRDKTTERVYALKERVTGVLDSGQIDELYRMLEPSQVEAYQRLLYGIETVLDEYERPHNEPTLNEARTSKKENPSYEEFAEKMKKRPASRMKYILDELGITGKTRCVYSMKLANERKRRRRS